MLQTLHGGAACRPLHTRSNALEIDLYQRIAPELFLKRAVAGGLDRVSEVNRNFRQEGVESTHSPEFAVSESYQAWGSYEHGARPVHELVQAVAPRFSAPRRWH